jgi:hypothetical protein
MEKPATTFAAAAPGPGPTHPLAGSPVPGNPGTGNTMQAGPGQGQMDPLAELRQIHLPDPVSDFPAAPGWWILLILVLVGGYFAIRWAIRYWKGNRYRRSGIKQLNALLKQYEYNEDAREYLNGFSTLLKRLAITIYPRNQVASLTGEEWVAFLDRTAKSKSFSMGDGQILMYGLYEREVEFDVEKLHQSGLNWIRKHRKLA